MITFDDFKNITIQVGEILEVEPVEKSEKLLRLKVSFGEESRQVVSGIAQFKEPNDLVGVQALFVTNLEPRSIMGLESQAMILAIHDGDELALAVPESRVTAGEQVG